MDPQLPWTQDQNEPRDPGDPSRPRFVSGAPVPHREMWILDRFLGGGGFGEVWLARHEYKDVPPVAVKFCTHPDARHRLVTHEKKVIVRVLKCGGDHPNVVPLLDCNLSGDTPWLVYEYVPGGTLADAFEEWRAMKPPVRIARTICTLHPIAAALARFHRLDPPIVHRDMKPHNVLMAGGTVPRITDFGIGAVAAAAGAAHSTPLPTMLRASGTPDYCSPEQRFGSPPHPRDDVYALGVIAYKLLLADLRAVPGPDAADELRDLGVPSEFVALVSRSMAFNPDRRPRDAGVWEVALSAWLPNPVTSEITSALAAPSTAPYLGDGAGHQLTVVTPGTWFSRPAGVEKTGWCPVTETPATVRIATDEHYALRVGPGTADEGLAGLRALSGTPALRSLDLSWCERITDAGLVHLVGLNGLQSLDLSGCSGVTDAGLEHVAALAGLRHLDLSCCSQVTDAGLTRLTALKSLRRLSVLVCERVTDECVAGFQAAVPGCKIRS